MFRQSTNQNHYPLSGSEWRHWTALTAGRFRRCWEEKTTRSNRMNFRLRHNLHTQISCCYRGFFHENLNKIDKYIILWHLVASLMILWYENEKNFSSKKQKNATFFANWFFLTWYSFNSTLAWCYFFISTFLSFSSEHYIFCSSISIRVGKRQESYFIETSLDG